MRLLGVVLASLVPALTGCGSSDGNEAAVKTCTLVSRAEVEQLLGHPLSIDPYPRRRTEPRVRPDVEYNHVLDIWELTTKRVDVTITDESKCFYIGLAPAAPGADASLSGFGLTVIELPPPAQPEKFLAEVLDKVEVQAAIDDRPPPPSEPVAGLGAGALRWFSDADRTDLLVVTDRFAVDLASLRLDETTATAIVQLVLDRLAALPAPSG